MTGLEAEKQEEGGDRLCLQLQASSGWPTSSSQARSPNSPFSVTTSDESIHEEASAHVLRLPLHNRASSEPPHRSPGDAITGGSPPAGGKPLPLSPSPPLSSHSTLYPPPSSHCSSCSFRRPRAPVTPSDARFSLCPSHGPPLHPEAGLSSSLLFLPIHSMPGPFRFPPHIQEQSGRE